MRTFVRAAEIGTGGARTLPGHFYTSPEVFGREQERIFRRRWLCAGREEWIPEPGDYFVRTLGTESVIVLRDREGRVRAFHNLCRHRGTRLCTEERGRFSQSILCPYHFWSYSLSGELRGGPGLKNVPGFDPSEYPLLSAPLEVWEGFLFLCMGEPEEPFAVSHAPLLGKFAAYNLPRLRSARRIDYDVRANWKLLFENYSECYHCAPAHPTLVKRSPADSGSNDLIEGSFLGGPMELAEGCAGLTMSGRACSIPVGDLSEADRRRVYYYALFPNMLLSLHADYVMTHTFWPQAPDRTRIECEWLFHPDAANHAGFDPDDGVSLWDLTNREDWRLCELSQLGVSSRAYAPGPYMPSEGLSAAFDQEVLRALEITLPPAGAS